MDTTNNTSKIVKYRFTHLTRLPEYGQQRAICSSEFQEEFKEYLEMLWKKKRSIGMRCSKEESDEEFLMLLLAECPEIINWYNIRTKESLWIVVETDLQEFFIVQEDGSVEEISGMVHLGCLGGGV